MRQEKFYLSPTSEDYAEAQTQEAIELCSAELQIE